MSTRRSALQPFELSDGTKLNVGDWACTPVRAIMQDPEHYPRPLEFNGFRFVDPRHIDRENIANSLLQPQPSKLTDVGNTYHVWGTGRMAWYVGPDEPTLFILVSHVYSPGRFYAACLMKVIIGQLIMNYDFELVEPDAPRWFTWRSTTLPKEGTMVIFTPRSCNLKT